VTGRLKDPGLGQGRLGCRHPVLLAVGGSFKLGFMDYAVGKKLWWVPDFWKWDEEREVEVTRVYPRGQACLSNGVIVDAQGCSLQYSTGRMVGRVEEMDA